MYKLIIVDDELLVQVGIKSMLDWEKEEIDIVGMASNGEQAYELIEEKEPDIVITDIKMPVMDGIALMKQCKEKLSYMPQFILLTSHEEFSFAREAVSLQVVDYLVKLDLNAEVLTNAIHMAKERSTYRKQIPSVNPKLTSKEQIEKIFKSALNNFIEGKQLRELVSDIDERLCDNLYLLCFALTMKNRANMIKSEEENIYHCVENTCFEIINKIHCGYVIPIDSYQFLMIVSAKETKNGDLIRMKVQEMLERMIQVNGEYFNVELKIGCSKFKHRIEELFLAYNEARRGLLGKRNLVFFDEVEEMALAQKSFDITLFSKEIISCYEQGDAQGIHTIFRNIGDLFREMNPRIEQLQDCCNKLLYFVLTSMDKGEKMISYTIKNEESGFQYINGLKSVGEIVDWLASLSRAICEEMSLENKDYSSRLAVETKNYIKEHVEGKLLLTDVAAHLEVNSSYLSLIFKRYSGIGFSDYVNQVKIEHAKALLCSGELKIYEVAERLGYDNAYYFSRVFKKHTGITPKEYTVKSMTQSD
ncbi:response regulator transcription factor [Konateibacter massiliensis]|uniref:response regulator transcription factor n=1 Tax=Konateibacter massiliensis TaxID=2002841 RepID=UPI000C14D90B|nr:response regulator [Konateibacter massiliensis]